MASKQLSFCIVFVLCLGMTSVMAQKPKLNSSGSLAGPGVITSDSWGVAKATVENPTPQDQKLLATVTFNKNAALSNVQFAREFWIPANSKRDIFIPIKTPAFSLNTKALDAQVQLLDTQGNSDIFLSRDSAFYRTATTSRLMAKLLNPKNPYNSQLTSNLQKQLGNNQPYQNYPAHLMPEDANLMTNIGVLLVGHSDINLNPMQMQALRQWVLNGGQLQILLPETGMTFCRALLGDHLPMQVVDQTNLTSVILKGKNKFRQGALTARISHKSPQPRGWNLGNLKPNRVDINGGGTRFRNPDHTKRTVISSTAKLSPSWSKAQFKGRLRLSHNTADSGVVMRVTFLNANQQVIGDAIDLVKNVTSRWQNFSKIINLPENAVQAKIEVGLENTAGILWASSLGIIPTRMHFDHPVAFWRVLAPTLQTHQSLMQDGWPMMLRKKIGRGSVTLLTLGIQYWATISQTNSPIIDRAFRTTPSSKIKVPMNLELLTKVNTQQIGYQVLSRTPVMICLISLFVIMVLASLLFWKQGRPELLAPVSVLLALLTAGIIWGLGLTHHRQTPLTIASIQLAEIEPVSNYALTDGVVCTYSPTRLQSPLSATLGGVIWPDLSGSTGKLLRMKWTDSHKWQWDNLELPEGSTRTHEIHRVMPLQQPVKAVASFNRQGMICTIESGPYVGIDHPIIASRNDHAVGKVTGQDNFTVTSDLTLGLDQFVNSTTMTATDIQRQEVYRSLIYPNADTLDAHAYPSVPSAMWWSKTMDMGMTQGSDKAQNKQYAIVCVPLSYQRPAPGSTFVIPSPVLEPTVWRDGSNARSMVINPINKRWISVVSQEVQFKLAFQIPPQLLPLKLHSGVLTVDFKMSGRSLIITTANGEEIARHKDIASRINIPIRTDQLKITPQGKVILGFEVTPHDNPLDNHMWNPSGGVRLELTAVAK
ncbi:MAG: hypothetical protein JKX85_13015 [Phycisphaeraceae bacterium]|nr:hypothetical protein [Phycisphaeraceae bacterium]